MPQGIEPGATSVYRVRVDLVDADPPIWRRLEIVGEMRLSDVHHVLQGAMGWEDSHLHAFQPFGGDQRILTRYDVEEEGADGLVEDDVRLDQVLNGPGDRLSYEYDFGDSWDHDIVVEHVRAARDDEPVARCLDGGGACPPEDVGGVFRYGEIADALRNGGELDAELREWLPPGFDPDAFDAQAADASVRRHLGGAPPPVVLDVIGRSGPEGAVLLVELVAEARERGAVAPDPVAVQAFARPWFALLDAIGDGVKLTQAGYLPPDVVRRVLDEVDPGWIGKGNREDVTPPVAEVRRTARELGLVRVHNGTLRSTKRAGVVRRSPHTLLPLVAQRLPAGRDGAERHAGVVALLLLAAGVDPEATPGKRIVAQVLTAIGWRIEGARIGSPDAFVLVLPTVNWLRGAEPDIRVQVARLALDLDP